MKYFLFSGIVLLTLFFQASVTIVPIMLVLLLLLYIEYRSEEVFFIAFFLGLLLDMLVVRTIGVSSLFFLTFLFVVFLYQRKFEIGSPLFVFLALFLGSVMYCFIFGIKQAVLIGICLGILGEIVFILRKHLLLRRIWRW